MLDVQMIWLDGNVRNVRFDDNLYCGCGGGGGGGECKDFTFRVR